MVKKENNRLKILCCVDQFYHPFDKSIPMGGGGKSLYGLLSGVKEEMEIHVLCFNNPISEGIYLKDGLTIHNANYVVFPKLGKITEWLRNKKEQKYIERIVKDIKPDLIIGQRYAIPAVVKIGYKKKIPTIVRIMSYENIYSSKSLILKSNNSIVTNDKKIKKYLRYIRDIFEFPFAKSLIQQNKKAFKKVNVVITVSNFVAKIIKESYGIDSQIVYPCVDFSDYKVNVWNPRYITYIRPTLAKGVEIFLRIVEELKDKRFLCVGKASEVYERRLRKLNNVTYTDWVGDMRSIYAKTKILVAPALWHEPLPRVVIEAMCNKIPCIVSNRGGLPEAIGNAGIVIEDPYDIKSWVNKIRSLCENSDIYNDLSKRSYERTKLFDFKEQRRKFRQIVLQLAKRKE